jgi:multiple sugar transport system substrate-binding protein
VGDDSGSSGGGSDGDLNPSAARGALRTSGFGPGDEIATTRVDRFGAANPKIKLTVNEGDFDAQHFLSSVASGNPPDAVYMEREVPGTYAGRRALQDLGPCVEAAGIRMDDFRQLAVDQVTLQDKVYGVRAYQSRAVTEVRGGSRRRQPGRRSLPEPTHRRKP